MRELSLNILDIAQNSIAADAQLITVEVIEDTSLNTLAVNIIDNGRGMTEEQLMSVRDPFFTTRTTRKVGMGIPLFKLAAEQTGGCFSVNSALGKGTQVSAVFKTDSIDFTPLGDISSTVVMLVTMNTDREFIYRHKRDGNEFVFDTREIKQILGDVPLNEPEITAWIREYINENITNLYGGADTNENT